jgi:alcohol dehydrogenase (NADP+)
VRLDGTFCTVGLPEEPIPVHAFSLLGAQVNFTASGIGSIQEIEDMLAFAAKHNVRPIIQRRPMDEVNEGIKSVRDGSVRFRVVLENPGAK